MELESRDKNINAATVLLHTVEPPDCPTVGYNNFVFIFSQIFSRNHYLETTVFSKSVGFQDLKKKKKPQLKTIKFVPQQAQGQTTRSPKPLSRTKLD